jgi:hypothetical protein
MRTKKNFKDLPYWKNNAEEDYMTTPISVLRYISELESRLGLTEDSFKPIPVPEDEIITGNKLCVKCNVDKPKSEYTKSKRTNDGLNYVCKPCQDELSELRNEDNAAYQREYNVIRKKLFDYSDPFYMKNTKVCTKCGIDKPLLAYARDAKGTNGLKCSCNECRRPYYGKLKDETYDPSIYRIVDKNSGEVLYVGESTVPELRKQKHFSGVGGLPISNSISSGEIKVEDLLFEVIERVEDRTERLQRETYWILKDNPKFNIRVK